jgi:hypothetical protein
MQDFKYEFNIIYVQHSPVTKDHGNFEDIPADLSKELYKNITRRRVDDLMAKWRRDLVDVKLGGSVHCEATLMCIAAALEESDPEDHSEDMVKIIKAVKVSLSFCSTNRGAHIEYRATVEQLVFAKSLVFVANGWPVTSWGPAIFSKFRAPMAKSTLGFHPRTRFTFQLTYCIYSRGIFSKCSSVLRPKKPGIPCKATSLLHQFLKPKKTTILHTGLSV